jgi:allantoin racemase
VSVPATRPALRFWHQSMTELDSLGAYRDFLISHARAVLGDEVALEVQGLRNGSYHGRSPTAALGNAFAYHRILDQILDNAIDAQSQGFDAFVIGSFSEPFLREIRSVLDIPVVSVLEASMLVACSLGHSVAPIANAPAIASMVQVAVEKHGLTQRILACAALEPALHEAQLARAFGQPEPVLDAFRQSARAALRHGAEVIIPAEGVLATLVSANGLAAVDGAPVVDVFAVSWRYGVMMARLRQDRGLQVSTVGHYARGDQALIQLLTK